MKGLIDQTSRGAKSNSAMKKKVIMLVTMLLGIGLAKAHMQELRDGELVSESATLLSLFRCLKFSQFGQYRLLHELAGLPL